jgi:hypothetical protein
MVGSSAIAMGNGGLDIDAIEKKMVNFNRSDTEREQLLNVCNALAPRTV